MGHIRLEKDFLEAKTRGKHEKTLWSNEKISKNHTVRKKPQGDLLTR